MWGKKGEAWTSTIPQQLGNFISWGTLFDTIESFRIAPIIDVTARVLCQLLFVRSRLNFQSQTQTVVVLSLVYKVRLWNLPCFCYHFTLDSNKRLLICLLKPLTVSSIFHFWLFISIYLAACIAIISTVRCDRGTTAKDKLCVLSLFWNSWNVSEANNAHLHNSLFMFFYLHIRWAQSHHDCASVFETFEWKETNSCHSANLLL